MVRRERAAQGPIPAWAWIFVVVCVLLPIYTRGGAIPGAIGAGCAGGCVGVARSAHMGLAARLVWCIALSGVCWGLGIGLILAVTAAVGR